MNRGVTWLFAAILLGGIVARQFSPASEPLPVLDTLGGDFILPSTLGREASLSDFHGKIVMLNFGFTACPDVCPTVLSRMRDVLHGLSEDGVHVQPIFVTLDPARDTIDKLESYLTFFDESFVGMTGTDVQIAAATEPFKVFYVREELDSPQGYTLSHNTHIYLLDRRGRVRSTFDQGVMVPDMIATVRLLLEENGR